MFLRTWQEGKDSKSQETIALGFLSTHVASQDEEWKKEKQRSKKEQKKCKGYGFPRDLIKGSRSILKTRVMCFPNTIIIIFFIIRKWRVPNLAPRRHIYFGELLDILSGYRDRWLKTQQNYFTHHAKNKNTCKNKRKAISNAYWCTIPLALTSKNAILEKEKKEYNKPIHLQIWRTG